jgi:hypothetical protein
MITTTTPTIFVFYSIQFQTTMKSPWRQPDGPLKPVDELLPWSVGSASYFRFNPGSWIHGQKFEPLWPDVSEDYEAVRRACMENGWFKLENARRILSHIEERDAKGDFDSKSPGEHKMQAIRHRFRVCRRHVMNFVEPPDPGSPQEVLAGSDRYEIYTPTNNVQ